LSRERLLICPISGLIRGMPFAAQNRRLTPVPIAFQIGL